MSGDWVTRRGLRPGEPSPQGEDKLRAIIAAARHCAKHIDRESEREAARWFATDRMLLASDGVRISQLIVGNALIHLLLGAKDLPVGTRAFVAAAMEKLAWAIEATLTAPPLAVVGAGDSFAPYGAVPSSVAPDGAPPSPSRGEGNEVDVDSIPYRPGVD